MTAQGKMEVYATIKLTNATVSSVHSYIIPARPTDPPDLRLLQQVSFVFQKIEVADVAGGTMAMDVWGSTGGTSAQKQAPLGTILRDQVLPKLGGTR